MYKLNRTGSEVEALLDKIDSLGIATPSKEGLMSAADKAKLDITNIRYNTTHYWDCLIGYIPRPGEIVIYSDYKQVEIDGNTIWVPGIKIGSGNAYVQDLAFIGEADTDLILNHIGDQTRHITEAERAYWNNKLNVDDHSEVVEEALILNRN